MSSIWDCGVFERLQYMGNGIGDTKALEKYGIFLVSNNKRKMQGLPLRREVAKRKIKRK